MTNMARVTCRKPAAQKYLGYRLVQGKSEVERDLPVLNFPFVDIPTNLVHLEPAHVVYGVRGLFNRNANGVLCTLLRSTSNFDRLIDMLVHGLCSKGLVI